MAGSWRKYLIPWTIYKQKGQILIFTAFLLPLLIAACGFTVDFGNMYLHKSKLQNAADAAAIAGACAYRDFGDAPGLYGHDNADDYALFSIYENMGSLKNIEPILQAREDQNGTAYYRVRLEKEIPVYFLRLFGVGDTVSISAAAIAAIDNSGGAAASKTNVSLTTPPPNISWE